MLYCHTARSNTGLDLGPAEVVRMASVNSVWSVQSYSKYDACCMVTLNDFYHIKKTLDLLRFLKILSDCWILSSVLSPVSIEMNIWFFYNLHVWNKIRIILFIFLFLSLFPVLLYLSIYLPNSSICKSFIMLSIHLIYLDSIH